ncbi:DNA cytosine methyltransferase [Rhodococcus erythropolis]|uniref:DNA cytosine methyltransferase n=1 Tax=Rhodococcus erythropolis TaxID=1833 RepID=UPI0024B90C5C|nr:DNA cytosine methyltransferase [Rhodococcus erythropolis]MDJ0405851.1 DNA cytosine methyltransferase [Rhodococcus erythropolis]
MRIGSLFSGYGGLDLAALQLFSGASVAWHCEWDDAPSKILDHHWPRVPNLRDVTEVDWATIEPVDILTGGYPCQPFSAAGQRKGTDDERHLWPYVRDAIRLLRPRFTLLENVAGHRSLGFDRVLGDLAEDGMHVRWTSLRASDIGAPHHRERIFILVTDPAEQPRRFGNRDDVCTGRGSGLQQSNAGRSGAADTESERLPGQQQSERVQTEGSSAHGSVGLLPGIDWGDYGPAVRRWERLTRPAPAPTELNSNHKPRLNAAFAEWMMGLPVGHVTAVPGISRAHQLKAIGNGVCPQQAIAAYSSLLEMEVAA